MKILILGGTVFTGPHIVRLLAALGHEVRVYHRGEHMMELPPGVRKLNADISSLGLYREALQKLKFDLVVHMIAMTRTDAQDAVDAFAGYTGRVVVASSQDVYAAFGRLLRKEETTAGEGDAPAGVINESSPLRTSRYILGGDYEKLDVEETFLENAHRLPVTILRMPATYGPHDVRHRLFPYIKRMEDQRPAIILDPSFGNFRWSHAYVENVAHAFVLAITNEAAANRIYNISEQATPTVAERLHALARAAGYRGKIVVAPRDKCPPHLIKNHDFERDLVASDAALRSELGFAEKIPAEEGLKRTAAWQRTICPVQVNLADYDYQAEDQMLQEIGIIANK